MRRHFDCFAVGVAGPISASAPLSRSFRSVCSPLAECAAPASANSPPFRSRNLCSDSPPMAHGVQRPSGRHRFVSTPPSPCAIAVTTHPSPKSPAPMARPVVPLTRASLTAERFLFSHPTHHGCNPCQSRDGARRAAPGGDESDRFNTLSCRKRQRPFRSLFPTD